MHLEELPRGFEPEGTWQHAGGMLQPEVASAAAEVESLTLRHSDSTISMIIMLMVLFNYRSIICFSKQY